MAEDGCTPSGNIMILARTGDSNVGQLSPQAAKENGASAALAPVSGPGDHPPLGRSCPFRLFWRKNIATE